MKKKIKTKRGERTFFVRRPPKKIEKIFEKFLNEYLKNVCKILPQSYRSQQMKAGGILGEAVLVYETKFLKEPFEKAIKSFLKDKDLLTEEEYGQIKGVIKVYRNEKEILKKLKAFTKGGRNDPKRND